METKELKRCRTCGLLFSIGGFYKGRQSCKKCESLKQSSIRQRRNLTSDFKKVYAKTCIYCGETKSVSEFRRDSSKTDGYGSYCKECMRTGVKKNNVNNQINNKMEDFTFYDFEKKHTGRTLEGLQFSVNRKPGQCMVYFNPLLSEMISKKRLTHLRVREDNITGELHFVFNKERGIPINAKDNHVKNIIVRNKELTTFLATKTGHSNDRMFYIKTTSDLSNSKDYCTIKLLKVDL